MSRTAILVLSIALLGAGLSSAQMDGAPGSLIQKFSAPAQVVGTATVGESLWAVSGGTLYEFDVKTRAVLSSFAHQFATTVYGLGYDIRRKEFVLTDHSNSTIGRVDMKGAVTTVFPSPTVRPIGVAYDWNRDAYWVADWNVNVLHLMDATTGTTVQPSFSLTPSGCTRSADVGYSMFNDLLVIIGRDKNQAFIYRAGNPPVFVSAVTFGTTIPGGARGADFYPRTQTLWTDSYLSPYELFEFDLGLPRVVAKDTVSIGSGLSIGWVAGSARGLVYQGAASFTEYAPGIFFGTRWLPIRIDNLFFMSVTTPQIFRGFTGTLDGSGTASGGVLMPNIQALVGYSFSLAMVTVDPKAPQGIQGISGPLKVNITK